MSLWMTEEAVRWGMRVCSRSFPWQQRGFLGTTSVQDSSSPRRRLCHIWASTQSQNISSKSVVSPARFYSNGFSSSDELEESKRLSYSPANSDRVAAWKASPLLSQLPSCGSPSDVLDLATQLPPTFREVSNCLDRMWTTTKKMTEEQRRHELRLMFEHPALDAFLQKAMKLVGGMRISDMTYSLLSMIGLGVPEKSRVIQTFLRACQERLNDFDEKNLSILATCLDQLEDSPSVNTLKEGVKLIVKTRLPTIKNVFSLQTMICLLGKDVPPDLKRALERKALSMTEQFSVTNAQHMFSTMASTGFYSKPLLSFCSTKILENLNGVPFNTMFRLLQSCKELLYRDADLLNGISDHVASTIDVWTNKQLVLFLFLYDHLNFCPTALMEAFSEKVIANPEALTLKNLLCVLKVYSSLNYDLQHRRQQFLDSLSQVLDSYLPKMSGFELLKAVYCLCLLGHFPSAPLEQLLQSGALEQLAASNFRGRDRMFQTVDLCLRIDRPQLPRPLSVPASLLGDLSPGNPSVSSRVLQFLQGALHDQARATLQEMVVVERFYLVDGVITKPLTNRSSETEASAGDGCSPAESSQRIAAIYVPPSGFCSGTSTPRGHLATKIRHLKILGYTPVLITEQDLKSVSEESAADFLWERIFPERRASDLKPEVEQLGS
ncbi:FAST kinase domain-containing protein 2, mitochondrial [Mugil cephalus]|uniref:FAST kinase domain-containing protein 2, mitochondrial n=1 Tax=Mugil cephalus TaxID=48193 RepID=UPI001FB66693|nr:FAST kinase domain-containing protein 2, mitochondrial [Mugil cephalus]